MLKRILYGFSLWLLTVAAASGQSELTLPFLEDVFQSTHTNPAAVPAFRLSVGLPGISSVRAGVTNTGFTINDVIIRRTDSTLYLGMDKVLQEMKKNNFMYLGGSVDLFHVRLKVKDFFLALHATEYAEFRFSYPYDFVNFPWKGNGEYIGKKVDWKNLGVDAIHYREYGFGLVHHRDKKPLTYGGRIKLLTGFSNVHVQNKDLGLTTEQDMYRIDVISDAMVHTSLPDLETVGDDPKSYFTNLTNMGFALDLGATYRFGKHLDLHVAATNIGFIKWKSNVKNYGLVGGAYFEGFDPVRELYRDTLDLEAYADSLSKYFQTTETEDPYTTWLIPHFYAAAQYQLLEKTFAGASLFLEPYKSFRPALTLAVTQKVRTVFDVVLSYSIQYRSYNNIGLAVMVKPGPVQFYIAGDNLFRTWTNMTVGDANFTAPLNARLLNLRFGMNFVIDRLEQPDKQPLPTD